MSDTPIPVEGGFSAIIRVNHDYLTGTCDYHSKWQEVPLAWLLA